jgi:hypothetical protein
MASSAAPGILTTKQRESTAEYQRLNEPYSGPVHPWRKWGAYVSERSWGTVREDYGEGGDAWDHLSHDQARSKAYRWGEDAIAGICDRYQLLVFGFAFWNGRDPILKERMFGLTNREGNHGEDVKEYWFYLDNTPTHSYMRMLYKYPQSRFPYEQLIQENKPDLRNMEYELLDTGVFDEDRYFDIFIEYAKASPEDICIRLEAVNRGPYPAEFHCIPQLWFRNTWPESAEANRKPSIDLLPNQENTVLRAIDPRAEPLSNLQFQYAISATHLHAAVGGTPLFTDNESPGPGRRYTKEAFHRHIVHGEASVNPGQSGNKACIHYRQVIPPAESCVLRLRLNNDVSAGGLREVDAIMTQRRREADEFYAAIAPAHASDEERQIQRSALSGMLWSKQIYLFDVDKWLTEKLSFNGTQKPSAPIRNYHWRHLNSMRILAVPDCWEYPWFAAWDLAFQCVAISLVDSAFAKENLWLLLFEQFQHPNGQIPSYEWEFSDLNPPVHAWACWRVYQIERAQTGRGDVDFLKKTFHKLLINFAWWVNRVDSQGNNLFEGGFLGLDNITVIDRSTALGGGIILEQSDATGWMAFFCLSLMRIALELCKTDSTYEVLATKFFEHFVYISAAMKKMGGRNYQLWDEQDGFFYDVLRYPNGDFHKFRVRSLVGLIPLYAIEVLNRSELEQHRTFLSDIEWFIRNRPDLVGHACCAIEHDSDRRYVLAVVDRQHLSRIMARLLDPNEFLSPAGLRSLSKFHLDHPFHFGDVTLRYEPAESAERIKGGNSNWRGPVWFPTTFLLIESLMRFSEALGPAFAIKSASGDGPPVTPKALALELANRLISIFKRNERGFRPCYGGTMKFQQDPHWRDYLLFHEYFNGDDGAGLGATHQTGWTGLVANLIDEFRR